MATTLTYVYLLAAFCIANSMQQVYLPCPGIPEPENFKLAGCEKLPCNLKRGNNAEATFDFVVTEDATALKPKVDIQMGDLHVEYKLPEQNACKSLVNGQCPLEKGERATYHLKMPVEKVYPKISLTIQLSLVDQNNKVQVCLKVPSKVID